MHVDVPQTATPRRQGSVATIGVYDGVHLGHRRVVDQLRREAGQDLDVTVVTFDRHPLSVLRPEMAPKMLTTLDRKLSLLAEAGVDHCCVIPFDLERSEEDPEHFVKDLLVDRLAVRSIAVGEDFRFGRDRSGDVALLKELGLKFGFTVNSVPLAEQDNEPISSTRIRQLVSDGEVEEAAQLLGRPFSISGVVEQGDGRGGPELGFPTANLGLDPSLAQPGPGIYAGTFTRQNGETYVSAISVGRRPTFYEAAEPLIECYLIDFSGDLYGETVEASFQVKLRDELRFDSVEALIEQMHLDVARTKELLQPLK